MSKKGRECPMFGSVKCDVSKRTDNWAQVYVKFERSIRARGGIYINRS